MELKDFIVKFAEAIDVENPEALTPDTDFRDLDEWSSITALSVISMVEEECGVALRANEVRQAITIADLFHAVESKL
jgi:acyl carrier protein